MSRNFDDLIDTRNLSEAERSKLERVHEVLLTVDPPPELSTSIERPPAQVIGLPMWRRRRSAFALVAVAAALAASFAGGYFAGRPSSMTVTHVVAFDGSSESHFASLRVGRPDSAGNEPMVLTVSGLPVLKHAYYELFVERNGKPSFPCTGFKMQGSSMSVHFNVPYVLDPATKLVITVVHKGTWPGTPVMLSV